MGGRESLDVMVRTDDDETTGIPLRTPTARAVFTAKGVTVREPVCNAERKQTLAAEAVCEIFYNRME